MIRDVCGQANVGTDQKELDDKKARLEEASTRKDHLEEEMKRLAPLLEYCLALLLILNVLIATSLPEFACWLRNSV